MSFRITFSGFKWNIQWHEASRGLSAHKQHVEQETKYASRHSLRAFPNCRAWWRKQTCVWTWSLSSCYGLSHIGLHRTNVRQCVTTLDGALKKTRDYRKRGTKPQGWKMRDWNTRHHTARVEDAGLENANWWQPWWRVEIREKWAKVEGTGAIKPVKTVKKPRFFGFFLGF